MARLDIMIEADLAATGQATSSVRDDVIHDREQPRGELRPDYIGTSSPVDSQKDILSEVVRISSAAHQVGYDSTNADFVSAEQLVKGLFRTGPYLEHQIRVRVRGSGEVRESDHFWAQPFLGRISR